MDTLFEGCISYHHKFCSVRNLALCQVPLTVEAITPIDVSALTDTNYNPTFLFRLSLSFFFIFLLLPSKFELERESAFPGIRGTWDSSPEPSWNGCSEEGIEHIRRVVDGGCLRHLGEGGRTGKTWVLLKLNCLGIYEGTWWVISTLHNSFLNFMTNVNGNPNKSREQWENSFFHFSWFI